LNDADPAVLLKSVRPNIVQSIRAYRVAQLQQAAETTGQHFLYANLADATTKQEVSKPSPARFCFPSTSAKTSMRCTTA